MKQRTRWWQRMEIWILLFFLLALICNWIWFEYQLYVLESQLEGLPN